MSVQDLRAYLTTVATDLTDFCLLSSYSWLSGIDNNCRCLNVTSFLDRRILSGKWYLSLI